MRVDAKAPLWITALSLSAALAMALPSRQRDGHAGHPRRDDEISPRKRPRIDPPFTLTPPIEPTRYRQDPRGPYLGHASPLLRPYDIWTDNCHTAANAFCLSDPARKPYRGVLACAGPVRTAPQHHTASWEVLAGGVTCVYNGGFQCCWRAGAIPPDLVEGSANACAKWACGDQFSEEARFLPPGVLAEIPGAFACARQAAGIPLNTETLPIPDESPDKRFQCLRCCDERADLWIGVFPDRRLQQTFRSDCRGACQTVFRWPDRNEVTPPERLLRSCVGKGAQGTSAKPGRLKDCPRCCRNGVLEHDGGADMLAHCLRACRGGE